MQDLMVIVNWNLVANTLVLDSELIQKSRAKGVEGGGQSRSSVQMLSTHFQNNLCKDPTACCMENAEDS